MAVRSSGRLVKNRGYDIMYRYGAEVEQRIKADREELRRCRRGGRSGSRGRSGRSSGAVSELVRGYVSKLGQPEREIFERYFLQGVALEIIGGGLGKSASWCNDRIRRQLAAHPLHGGEGVTVRRYRRRLPAQRQRQQVYQAHQQL